jgi:hypothetical protein
VSGRFFSGRYAKARAGFLGGDRNERDLDRFPIGSVLSVALSTHHTRGRNSARRRSTRHSTRDYPRQRKHGLDLGLRFEKLVAEPLDQGQC